MVFHVFHLSCGFKFEHNLHECVCSTAHDPPHQHRPPSKPKLWPQLAHNLANKPSIHGMFSHNILQSGAKWPTWSPSPEMCQWVSGSCRPVTEGLGRQY